MRASVLVLGAALLAAAAGWTVFAAAGPGEIARIYRGESIGVLNRAVERHRAAQPDYRDLAYYNRAGRTVATRLTMVLFAAAAFLALFLARRTALPFLRVFFREASAPLNLAVFRLTVFGYLLWSFDPDMTLQFSRMPPELLFPPLGTDAVLSVLPTSEAWVRPASALFYLFAGLGFVGLFTPYATCAAAALVAYLWGIPQLYGKVDHYHHLLWFAVMLSASRCADSLSLDSVRAGWRRADRGDVEPPGPSAAYGLPLRIVWLLIGVVYFFPGFWKLWHGGVDWFMSENLKYQLHAKWAELGGWTPAFRIDLHPLLYKLSGLATIAFETAFGLMTLWPASRLLAALGGLSFHSMTFVFMRIGFVDLLVCYVAFCDWDGLLRRLGRRLFPAVMAVLYDGNCKLCRRTVATLAAFDVLRRLDYVNVLDETELKARGLAHMDRGALLKDMHAVAGRAVSKGFESYRALAWRMPVLWPALPFLYLPPVAALGRAIYRRVADARACDIRRAPAGGRAAAPAFPRAVAVTGAVLLAGSILFGATRRMDGWPFACYPAFDYITGPGHRILIAEGERADGGVVPIPLDVLQDAFGGQSQRYWGAVRHVLDVKDPGLREKKLKALWSLRAGGDPALRALRKIRFFESEMSTEPGHVGDVVGGRTLIAEARLER